MAEMFDKTSVDDLRLQVVFYREVWQDTKSKMPSYEGEQEIINLSDNTYTKVMKPKIKTLINVKDLDPLALCYTMTKNDPDRKVLIVSNACNTNMGGGVREGIANAEADLCRRTNYYKCLKSMKDNTYPIQCGTFLYTKNITVIKNTKYKRLGVRYNVDILSIVMKKRPSSIMMGSNEIYEKDEDKESTKLSIQKIVNIATTNKYNTIIFNNIGCGTDKHPTDDYIKLCKEVLITSGIELVFVLVPKGNTNGEGKDDRRIWKKYCTLLDNIDESHSDCDSPEDEPFIIKKKRKKKKKVLYNTICDSDIGSD